MTRPAGLATDRDGTLLPEDTDNSNDSRATPLWRFQSIHSPDPTSAGGLNRIVLKTRGESSL